MAKGLDPERPLLASEADWEPTSTGGGRLAERNRPGQSRVADGAPVPLWVPQGVDLEVVPQEVREAIAEVVQPVYERLVLDVDDPLEKSLGVTVAHLLWLEVLQQFDLKREYVQVSAVLGLPGSRSSAIEQHLRILYSKVKVGYLLARLRELRQKWHERSPGGASVPHDMPAHVMAEDFIPPIGVSADTQTTGASAPSAPKGGPASGPISGADAPIASGALLQSSPSQPPTLRQDGGPDEGNDHPTSASG